MLFARTLVGALAVLCAVVAFGGHRSDERCRAVITGAQRQATLTPAAAPGVARRALARCSSSTDAVTVAILLTGAGRRSAALTLARGLTRREPGDYLGWFVRSGLEPDPSAARQALARARALNPTVGRVAAP